MSENFFEPLLCMGTFENDGIGIHENDGIGIHDIFSSYKGLFNSGIVI